MWSIVWPFVPLNVSLISPRRRGRERLFRSNGAGRNPGVPALLEPTRVSSKGVLAAQARSKGSRVLNKKDHKVMAAAATLNGPFRRNSVMLLDLASFISNSAYA